MFKRKLRAIEYFNADNFNVLSEKDQRDLIVWIEDQKIRHYPIERRAQMRKTTSSDWPAVFEQYLNDIECPIDRNDTRGVLDWLVGLTAKLEYSDSPDKYKNATSENLRENAQNVPRVILSNPLDNLDFESKDFKQRVISLAKLLKITPQPDTSIVLRAIDKLVKKYFEQSPVSSENPKGDIKYFPFEEIEIGFSTCDPILDVAAKITQLLHIRDMRLLQTKVNETIVSLQKITANPKTDTRLGKVGF